MGSTAKLRRVGVFSNFAKFGGSNQKCLSAKIIKIVVCNKVSLEGLHLGYWGRVVFWAH